MEGVFGGVEYMRGADTKERDTYVERRHIEKQYGYVYNVIVVHI
jgi:hypothetical protein